MQQNKLKKHYSIQGDRICFQPYRRKYVRQYHSWFDQELLYLTGSQPLTLQEQYTNHKSWIQDPTKYTFIIFNEKGKMIGDINLFFSEWIEPYQAEINIMIAVKQQRGKGYARQALKIIESFCFVFYKKRQIIAKIKQDNSASIQLFLKSNYQFYNYEQRYKQNEYRKKLDEKPGYQKWLQGRVKEVSDVQSILQQA